MNPNPVVWFEIYVNDMTRAVTFYESVFFTQLTPLPTPVGDDGAAAAGMRMMAFPMQVTAAGAAGALVKMDGAAPGGGGTLVYLRCDDCAVELARVEAAGGKIHRGKFPIGEYGHCALIVDTEGNLVGLHSMG